MGRVTVPWSYRERALGGMPVCQYREEGPVAARRNRPTRLIKVGLKRPRRLTPVIGSVPTIKQVFLVVRHVEAHVARHERTKVVPREQKRSSSFSRIQQGHDYFLPASQSF